jgi:hypothetical protein
LPSKQADTGIVAQRTTTANIVNAPFLVQFMVFRCQVFAVSIRCRGCCGGDLDHNHLTRAAMLPVMIVVGFREFCIAPVPESRRHATGEPSLPLES